MKSTAPFAFALATAMLTGFAVSQDAAPAPAGQPAEAVSPQDMKNDVSYFLGFQNGNQMSSIPTLTADDIDMDEFIKGIRDGMTGGDPKVDQLKIQKSLEQFQEIITGRVEEMAKKNLETSKQFMAENGKKDGIVTTDTGLQYRVDKKGEGKKYVEADYKNPLFKIQYKGSKIDGTVFDETKGEAIEMPLQVIPGFAEALKLMPVGSTWTVYIPAELAYGENAPSTRIEPNEALIFELQLEDIIEGPEDQGGMPFTQEQLQQLLQQQGQ